MPKVGRFVTDPNAGSYCRITLESGEEIIVSHHKWRLTIELSKLLGFNSHRIFTCDLETPEGRTALAEVTRGAHPESVDATPLGAFVKHVKNCGTAADVKVRCTVLVSAR
jgi:hypothetical protein